MKITNTLFLGVALPSEDMSFFFGKKIYINKALTKIIISFKEQGRGEKKNIPFAWCLISGQLGSDFWTRGKMRKKFMKTTVSY